MVIVERTGAALFDLVMFAGMRESEAFALWCGNVATDGIYIERSFYKGLYEPPKTAKSDRHVGCSGRNHGAPKILDFAAAVTPAGRPCFSIVEAG